MRLLLALAALSCAILPAMAQPDPKDIGDATALATVTNDFGFRLFAKLSHGSGNLCFSPVTVSQTISLPYNGMDGETRNSVAKALGVHGLTVDQVNAGHRYLRDLLAKGDPTVTTRAANGMWLNPVEPDVLPEFAQRNQDFYGATFFRDDIHGDAGVNRMDAWVREQTGGKIFGLVKRDDLSEEARIVLVNAIYFKGQWAVAFDKAQTGDIDFYLAEGKTEMVPTMRRKGTFSYCETDDAQIINLPYGQGRLAILIALPKPRLALPMLTAKANVDTWRLWLASLKDTENLTLRLPRFRVATDFQLNDALRGVGMARAFNGAGPDFSLMNGVKTAGFDRVRHKAMLETSEDGVAPAAPAGAGVGPKMTINRPFLYAIHDKDTGAILLLGTVGNP